MRAPGEVTEGSSLTVASSKSSMFPYLVLSLINGLWTLLILNSLLNLIFPQHCIQVYLFGLLLNILCGFALLVTEKHSPFWDVLFFCLGFLTFFS